MRKKWIGLIIAQSILTLFISGCNGFHPQSNSPECVYGPPEWFEDETDDNGQIIESDDDTDNFDPGENIVEDVYGPPEWFE